MQVLKQKFVFTYTCQRLIRNWEERITYWWGGGGGGAGGGGVLNTELLELAGY